MSQCSYIMAKTLNQLQNKIYRSEPCFSDTKKGETLYGKSKSNYCAFFLLYCFSKISRQLNIIKSPKVKGNI